MKLHIAVLPGDGIGPEVVEQALNVTKAVCEKFGHSLEYQTAPVGAPTLLMNYVCAPMPFCLEP